MAGDTRANENVGLAVLHIIFHRCHNHIVDKLKSVNPQWNDERLFQQARKINIAMYQKIVVNEFLPRLTGEPTDDILGKYRSAP